MTSGAIPSHEQDESPARFSPCPRGMQVTFLPAADGMATAAVVEAKLVLKRPDNQQKVQYQAAYYGRMWARLHPNTYVVCIACTDAGAVTVPVLSERRFVSEASQRLAAAHQGCDGRPASSFFRAWRE